MQADEKSVNYWLGKADAVRAAARLATDARVRTHLLGSADAYEYIARALAADGSPGANPLLPHGSTETV